MTTIWIGSWLVEAQLNRLTHNSRVVQLEPKVMQVLVCLAQQPGEVVSKEELIRTVWNHTFVSEDVLTRSVSHLRKVFDDDPRHPLFIETISRKGYRLVATVRQVDPGVIAPAPLLPADNGRGAGYHSAKRESAWLIGAVGVAALACAVFLFLHFKSAPPVQRATMVVLPFVNLNGDPTEEYFSDGVTEEMIAALSRAGNTSLGVIARTSAMQYKNSTKGVAQISREVHADYVLEGSVRREGNRVRISARLVQARTQTSLWSEDYDVELKNVLSVQNEISQAVAQAIRVKLTEQKIIAPSVDPEAYQLYLKGRYFLDRPRNADGLRKALNNFEQAERHDPSFARAWASIALAYEMLEYVRAMSPRESYPYALAAANRALELDAFSVEAHLAMAYIHEHYEWNWNGSASELTKALQLDPNYELARQWLSYGLLRQGDTEAAEELYRKALSIAQEQEAKLWELRAAVSLAQLRRDQSRRAEARHLLAPVYAWFTEGFDTADLKEAKALLDELA